MEKKVGETDRFFLLVIVSWVAASNDVAFCLIESHEGFADGAFEWENLKPNDFRERVKIFDQNTSRMTWIVIQFIKVSPLWLMPIPRFSNRGAVKHEAILNIGQGVLFDRFWGDQTRRSRLQPYKGLEQGLCVCVCVFFKVPMSPVQRLRTLI